MLLPYYDVFDEQRYFAPATRQELLRFGGRASPSPFARTRGTTKASGRARFMRLIPCLA